MRSRASVQAQQLLDRYCHSLPKCIVLDLDYQVWPFWCEIYTVHDTPRLFPHVEGIIHACRERGILVTAASRTPTPEVATAFLKKSGLDTKFDNIQLIPAADGFDAVSAQKDTCHLPNIRTATGLQWRDMLFFDDEVGNVTKVQRLGVCSVLVPTSKGLCLTTFQQGLEKFAAQHG